MHPDEEMEVRFEILISQPRQGNNFRMSDSFILPSRSFLELCQIIGQFKELADKIKKEGA